MTIWLRGNTFCAGAGRAMAAITAVVGVCLARLHWTAMLVAAALGVAPAFAQGESWRMMKPAKQSPARSDSPFLPPQEKARPGVGAG
jgi:hypothetical protein